MGKISEYDMYLLSFLSSFLNKNTRNPSFYKDEYGYSWCHLNLLLKFLTFYF